MRAQLDGGEEGEGLCAKNRSGLTGDDESGVDEVGEGVAAAMEEVVAMVWGNRGGRALKEEGWRTGGFGAAAARPRWLMDGRQRGAVAALLPNGRASRHDRSGGGNDRWAWGERKKVKQLLKFKI